MPDHDWEGGDLLSRCKVCKLLHAPETGDMAMESEYGFIDKNDHLAICHSSWHRLHHLSFECPGKGADLTQFVKPSPEEAVVT